MYFNHFLKNIFSINSAIDIWLAWNHFFDGFFLYSLQVCKIFHLPSITSFWAWKGSFEMHWPFFSQNIDMILWPWRLHLQLHNPSLWRRTRVILLRTLSFSTHELDIINLDHNWFTTSGTEIWNFRWGSL